MDVAGALNLRLVTQRLAGIPFEQPNQAVDFLVAVQSQDYSGAKWSLGQRVSNCGDSVLDRAFDEGSLLRTHVLRPSWHFVSPGDIRWLLRLTGPHVKARNSPYYRKHDLDDETFARSQMLMAAALEGGNHLTRAEIRSLLTHSGFGLDNLRLGLIMMQAELDGIVCSGARRGKQHTYALLDERASNEKNLAGDDALAELTRRFFVSHGPATVKEFARWSGLTMAKCWKGLELVRDSLSNESLDGHVHWFGTSIDNEPYVPFSTWLLPEYDECYLTYPTVNFPALTRTVESKGWNDASSRPVIMGGKRAGIWRRKLVRKQVIVEAHLFAKLDDTQLASLQAAVDRFGTFMEMPALLEFV